MRIGFLFNHDQVHQVAHSLPIALALAESAPALQIVLAPTNSRIEAEVVRLAGRHLGPNLRMETLSLHRRSSKLIARIAEPIAPAEKLVIYADNLDFFRSLDVLVVAEKTSLILKTRYGLDQLKIVHTRHGAGDRAIGFNAQSAAFDHVLVSGPKIRARLIDEAGVAPERISVVGYPKFDLPAEKRVDVPPADGRTVVLYNPHVSPHLSSWYTMGRAVLDWFAARDAYQLIFAPHVMLFERPIAVSIDRMRIARPGPIDKRFLRAPNVLIDLGSRASTTMAYTRRADIYLGDVSSQVYEFLLQPRPCVFLNAHGIDWRGNSNYAHWRAGPVIESASQLGSALNAAMQDAGGRYADAQRQLFAESIELTEEFSATRAARAVARVAGVSLQEPAPALSRAHA